MITVLIVDDHDLVRLGLRTYLDTEADLQVIGEAADGAAAVAAAVALQPDVILMDLMMPGVSGIEATEQILHLGLQSRVVMLTSSVDDANVIKAIQAGAQSYLLKTSPAADVARAVRRAMAGESILDAQVQQLVVGQLQRQPDHQPAADLTEREREVLRFIAAGRSNQEIAQALFIGVKTVKTHVSNIFLKISVIDRTQAAIYAIRNGLD